MLWPPHEKNWLIKKTLMLGKIEGRRRGGQQRTRWLDGTTDSWTCIWASSGRWRRTGKPGVLQLMGSQSQTWLSDWTTTVEGGTSGKEPTCDAGDVRDSGSTPGLGRSPRVGYGNLLQYSFLENSMDRRAWWATDHGVRKSRTRLSGWAHTQMI